MPFGTGNDIGRSLGWGGTEGKLDHDLEYLAACLVNGAREKLSLWEAEFYSKETYTSVQNQRVRID